MCRGYSTRLSFSCGKLQCRNSDVGKNASKALIDIARTYNLVLTYSLWPFIRSPLDNSGSQSLLAQRVLRKGIWLSAGIKASRPTGSKWSLFEACLQSRSRSRSKSRCSWSTRPFEDAIHHAADMASVPTSICSRRHHPI